MLAEIACRFASEKIIQEATSKSLWGEKIAYSIHGIVFTFLYDNSWQRWSGGLEAYITQANQVFLKATSGVDQDVDFVVVVVKF